LKNPNTIPVGRRLRLWVRRAASCIAGAVLRLRSRPLDPGLLASVLIVAPHPDDESFGCGGTLALMAKRGVNTHVAFVTEGGGSHLSHPVLSRDDMCTRRRIESKAALVALGVNLERVTYFNAIDGTLAHLSKSVSLELVDAIAALLSRLKPAAVFLPCRSDGSSEHDAAFVLVHHAIRKAVLKPRILEYPIWSWWNPSRLIRPVLTYKAVWRVGLGDAIGLKAAAIAAYASQTHPIPPETLPSLPDGFAQMFLQREEFFLEHRDKG
jgi:LmbE family N-acetylglucosaminyl deacetylase